MAPPAAILDIDGTLVDTNYQHALAWFRALGEHGAVVPLWRIHRHMGMGGDKIVAALAGDEFEQRHGEDARAAESERYGELIDEVQPLPGARELVRELHQRGHAVVLASSAKETEVEHYLGLLGVADLIVGYSTSADVEQTKPDPDIVKAALAKLSPGEDHERRGSAPTAVLVGDSTFDCEAAKRAGIETIAVLSGGFGAEELRDAGAAIVLESVQELCRELGKTPLSA